jgi:hypothetical protein
MSSTQRSQKWFPASLAFQARLQQRLLCRRYSQLRSSQKTFLLLNVQLLGVSSLLSCRQQASSHRPNQSFKRTATPPLNSSVRRLLVLVLRVVCFAQLHGNLQCFGVATFFRCVAASLQPSELVVLGQSVAHVLRSFWPQAIAQAHRAAPV